MSEYTYELLCVDSHKKSDLKSEVSFLHYLMSLESIWIKPELKQKKIIDSVGLSLTIKKIKGESDNENTIFRLIFQGDYLQLEVARTSILAYITKQGFSHIYVLKDSISKEIAKQLYPLINEVETTLRKYLIQFFVIKLGPDWWNLTADNDMKSKTNSGRKNNEIVFSEWVENKIYLIDFSDLGKLVYLHSAGFINKEDILGKILNLEESITAIQDLKKQLQNNYNRFFKETFKDKSFQHKWEDLEKIRHKVAHNNLFTNKDLIKGKDTSTELLEIIEDAISKIETIDLSPDEVTAIRETIVLENSSYKIVSEETFLSVLDDLETWSKNQTNGYVSAGKLINEVLGGKGYDYRASNEVLQTLIIKDVVEIYTHLNKQCVRKKHRTSTKFYV